MYKTKCVWAIFERDCVCFDVSATNGSKTKRRSVHVPRAEAWRLADWSKAIEKRAGRMWSHAFGYYWISEEACIRSMTGTGNE